MGALLKWLIGFPWCSHKWKVLERGGITERGSQVGTFYILQCEKCGDVKVRNLC